MLTRCRSQFDRFQSSEDGTVAMIFGLMSIVLIFMGGVAVDYTRVIDTRTRLSSALDSASLAAGRALLDGKLSDGEIVTLAEKYVKQNASKEHILGTINDPVITLNRATGLVDISIDAEVEMTLARVAGFDKIDVPVRTESVYQQRDIEVGMALDVTGSMDTRIKGVRKIDALKTAFETFADKLMPDQKNTAQKVRIGLAPYAASVNLGTYANYASNNTSVDGCVVERDGGGATDATGIFKVANAASVDVDPTEGKSVYSCPNARLTPLSDDKTALIREVKTYTAGGFTAGHIGAQWAWNIISEDWGRVFGGSSAADSYEQVEKKKLLKAVVFMTDGVFNTAFNGGKSSEQALALCTAMKAKGVVVFSVGFGLGSNATALNTLRDCATPGSQYFVDAASPEELEAAFSSFAGTLTALRLSQ